MDITLLTMVLFRQIWNKLLFMAIEQGVRLKIDIFDLGRCGAVRPKVPTDYNAACAAE